MCSVLSLCDSIKPNRFLCPRDFPDKNTGVGCHFLLQEIFSTQGSNLGLLCLKHWQVDSLPLSHWETHNSSLELFNLCCIFFSVSPFPKKDMRKKDVILSSWLKIKPQNNYWGLTMCLAGLSGGSWGKESPCYWGDVGSVSRSRRSPGGGHGNLLQYSRLQDSIDRAAWQTAIHGAAESWTPL